MQSGSWRQDRYNREASPASRTLLPSVSSSTTTLPPISSLTRGSDPGRDRKAHASTSSSPPPHTFRTSTASLSSPSSSKSLSSRSSPHNEPVSPVEGHPLLAFSRSNPMAAPRSPAHRTYSSAASGAHHHMSSTDAHALSHHHSDQSQHSRHLEDGSHLWGDGMKGIWNSLTGAPHGKSRSPRVPQSSGKGEHLEPVRASEVEAATSIWDVPRDTVAMTMGFHGNYEDQPFQQHHSWQQQQQQQQQSASYPAAEQHQSYSSLPAPSGLAGGTAADGSRSRGNSDVAAVGDRHYSRSRPSYQHGRSSDSFADAPHSSQWWPAESHAAPEDASSHYSNRRLQPPPLPETRTASRPAWTNPGGFEISGYEFPQSTLGKRQYDEDAMAGSGHGGVGEAHDSATRRYSLAANMSFSRPSAPISSMMSGYRPSAHSDPRRPSLPTDQYGAQQSPAASSTQRGGAGYSSATWSPWSQTTSHSGVAGSMSTSSSSPNPGWRDTSAGVRYGIEAGYPSPSGLAGTAVDKRQQRDRSSSSASAVQQANVLANTPFHITTDIVLRAPAGSKMDDVYYDQHCELRTGMADPPKEDFEVENEEDRPRRQTDKLRFPGDLYTPRWVRGSGNAREAWCDRCESGNWLQLKNSQYWYDQVHKHGISSVSGLRFTAPTHLKVYADAAGTVEAKCHQCKEWVLICTAKRRRNFAAFFKHAHACHSYRKASAVGNGPYVEHNPGGHRNGKKGEGSG